MRILVSLLVFSFISMTLLSQGTMSTDDTTASEAPASLSGSTDEEIDLREEEVQMEEDPYYEPEENLEYDEELLDEYESERQY